MPKNQLIFLLVVIWINIWMQNYVNDISPLCNTLSRSIVIQVMHRQIFRKPSIFLIFQIPVVLNSLLAIPEHVNFITTVSGKNGKNG